jgi:CHAT domain-containing protein
VLSACDTGLGEVRTGEGVFGLRRAFMLAGARTLVMGLWKVEDLAAAILMERFYENLLQHNTARDQSLREAQLYVRDLTVGQIRKLWLSPGMIERLTTGKPDDDHPFRNPRYWGAFICQGEPERITLP